MTTQNVPYRTTRRFVRIPLRFVVDYREYKNPLSDRGVAVSRIKNISGGGLLLETNRSMERGMLLEISLNIPGWHRYRCEKIKPDWTSVPEPLILVGTVARCKKIEAGPGERFDVGIAFTEIDPDDRAALLKYLEDAEESRT